MRVGEESGRGGWERRVGEGSGRGEWDRSEIVEGMERRGERRETKRDERELDNI